MTLGQRAQIPHEFVWFGEPGLNMSSYGFGVMGPDSTEAHMTFEHDAQMYMYAKTTSLCIMAQDNTWLDKALTLLLLV